MWTAHRKTRKDTGYCSGRSLLQLTCRDCLVAFVLDTQLQFSGPPTKSPFQMLNWMGRWDRGARTAAHSNCIEPKSSDYGIFGSRRTETQMLMCHPQSISFPRLLLFPPRREKSAQPSVPLSLSLLNASSTSHIHKWSRRRPLSTTTDYESAPWHNGSTRNSSIRAC